MQPVDQAALWNGEEGLFWAAHDERMDAMLSRFSAPVLDAAAITSGDAVLDVGCGCGFLSRRAALSAAPGRVLGVDLSAPMLARARARAAEAGLSNVAFEQRDAQQCVPGRFDVLLSRFGVMFFPDVRTAFAALAPSLRPGARVAFVCWRERAANENRVVPHEALSRHLDLPLRQPRPGQPGAFSLADPGYVRDVLTAAGLRDVSLQAVDEPLWFGADVEDAVRFHLIDPDVVAALADVPPSVASAVADELRAAFARHVTPEGVLLGGAAWLVTARR